MRFAPPPAMRVSDRGGGLNQTSVRTYNERLVMSLLRQHDQLSRMELGVMSGLSAQTVSVIVRALERDNLILRGEAQRGRVGPPSIPMGLNPDGAFAIGIKVGLRSMDAVLIDYVGTIRQHRERLYRWPDSAAVLEDLGKSLEAMRGAVPEGLRDRLTGVGISLPGEIENWPQATHPSSGPRWEDLDFEGRVAQQSGLPTLIQNDVTAAAGAEMIFGVARKLGDFAYFFVGAETSSRLVLNHRIYAPRRGADTPAIAAIGDLAEALERAGQDAAPLWHGTWNGSRDGPGSSEREAWIEACGAGLAGAVRSLSAFIDLDTVIIDGRMPPPARTALCATVAAHLHESTRSKVVPGQVGALAKAVGAASLPFHSRFMVEKIGLAAD